MLIVLLVLVGGRCGCALAEVHQEAEQCSHWTLEFLVYAALSGADTLSFTLVLVLFLVGPVCLCPHVLCCLSLAAVLLMVGASCPGPDKHCFEL